MTGHGLVYVATKHDRYVEEAFLSAESVKQRYPDMPIALFTDRDRNALCTAGCFDRVETVDGVSGFGSDWAEGQLNRLKALQRTPFEYTLHLDTDTRVYSKKLPSLFDFLPAIDVAMVEDPPDNSYAARQSGWPMFNAGFILYRKSDQVWTWLTEWIALTERNFRWATQEPLPPTPALSHLQDDDVRRALLRMDQISLTELLSPDRNVFDLKLKSLDPAWNYRGSRLEAFQRKTIEILHSHALKKTMPDLLATADRWAEAGRDTAAETIYAYVAAAQTGQASVRPKRLFGLGRSATAVPEHPASWSNPAIRRGELHLRYGQNKPAAKYFQTVLARDTGNADALVGAARIALREGRLADASTLAETALAQAPGSAPANAIHGEILVASGQNIDAIAPLALAQKSGDAHAAFLQGQAWFALKNYGKAASAYKAALDLNPHHAAAANNLLAAYLGQRKYAAALTHADALLEKRPWHVQALAFKTLALAELGRNGEAANLSDFDRFLKTETLPVPAGYRSIDDFNKALAKALTAEPSLAYEPRGHTTRFGLQSGNLAEHPSKVVQTLHSLLLDAVRARTDEVRKARGTHPFEKACPSNYTLHSWVTMLEEQGHQAPHMHASGWLSGVYYIEVPQEVMDAAADQQGWLVFGPGDERWQRPETKTIEHVIRPEPGALVTFPSFFWHSTRPLRTSVRRISYAFDIVPE